MPLILMVLVVFTGLAWLVDILFFAKARRVRAANVSAQFDGLSEDNKKSDEKYLSAMAAASKEPVVIEYSKSFFPVLALVFVLRSFIIEPFQIPSESMVPTLEVGDFIVVNKFSYGIRLPVFRKKIIDIGEPKRGDVVVFFPPHEDRYFIKRLVGLPGDKISYIDNVLYINGEEAEREFLHYDKSNKYGRDSCYSNFIIYKETIGDNTHISRRCEQPVRIDRQNTWVVPEGHYFMMGDNRDNSADSRAWYKKGKPAPFVPDENIVGKAFGIWMHWRDGLPSFSRAGKIE